MDGNGGMGWLILVIMDLPHSLLSTSKTKHHKAIRLKSSENQHPLRGQVELRRKILLSFWVNSSGHGSMDLEHKSPLRKGTLKEEKPSQNRSPIIDSDVEIHGTFLHTPRGNVPWCPLSVVNQSSPTWALEVYGHPPEGPWVTGRWAMLSHQSQIFKYTQVMIGIGG